VSRHPADRSAHPDTTAPRIVIDVMSESESYKLPDEAYEQLVAYLDGELDTETSRQVEQRLAEDLEYQHELRHLQRAWDLLDELPRAEVSETFTQTTVEMVALSAARELETTEGQRVQRGRLLWASGVASLVAAALLSYLGWSAWLARPNRQLLRDLPVIEAVELYRVADDVEFLRQLRDAGLFDEEDDHAL
jgi:anti-sigma-K factor RskA